MFFLAAGDGEDSFWFTLLVGAILASAGGIYSLARSRAKKSRPAPVLSQTRTSKSKIVESKTAAGSRAASIVLPEPRTATPKRRDTKSGLELLTRDFLVGVIEETGSVDKLNISMRCMCFNELVRRSEIFALSSEALKAYVLNEGGFFDKTIRSKAMAELAGRTEQETPIQTHPSSV